MLLELPLFHVHIEREGHDTALEQAAKKYFGRSGAQRDHDALAFPWQDEAISICLHKPRVYVDLSGWSPKYFSPTLVQYANTLLKPQIAVRLRLSRMTPDRCLSDFEKIGVPDEVPEPRLTPLCGQRVGRKPVRSHAQSAPGI